MKKNITHYFIHDDKVFTIISFRNRICNDGFCESRRHICRLYNLQLHQQRCVCKNIKHKPFPIYKHTFALSVSQNVTAGYIPPPIFVYIEYVLPPTTLCQYNISPKIPRANITHADKFFNYIRICTRCSVTAYVTTKGVTMSSRHISSSNNLQPHQQRCVYKI